MELKTGLFLTEEEKKRLLSDILNVMRKAYPQRIGVDNWKEDTLPALRSLALQLAAIEEKAKKSPAERGKDDDKSS